LFSQPAADADHELVRRLRALEVDETTPRAALELLAELKKIVETD
jgi:type III secretion system FlhB-like substrate exporter